MSGAGFFGIMRSCPNSEVRKHSPRPLSGLRNRKDTSNFMILVPLLNPKFATVPAEKSCELRVRGTRACSDQAESEHALDFILGRIFYGEPASTSPENALSRRHAQRPVEPDG